MGAVIRTERHRQGERDDVLEDFKLVIVWVDELGLQELQVSALGCSVVGIGDEGEDTEDVEGLV